MAFCDFCSCHDCQTGQWPYNRHAQCEDGRWICDVCWTYDVCTSGPGRNSNGPCEDERWVPVADCPHRPKLVSEWTVWNWSRMTLEEIS